MNKYKRFAIAMSILLFEMRSEDLYNEKTILYYEDKNGDQQEIPPEYVDKILDTEIHQDEIIKRLKVSVEQQVQQFPLLYQDHKGKLGYHSDIYEHAYLIDTYIENQYVWDHPEFHCMYICSACGSDNVRIKAWVQPNSINKFVDELNPDEPGYCLDCQQNVMVDTAEVNVRHKVIGFQVVKVDGSTPDSPVIYDLPFCRKTLKDNPLYKLKTVWSDIKDPIKMFLGDPRNPSQK